MIKYGGWNIGRMEYWRGGKFMSEKIHIGTSAWNYKHWFDNDQNAFASNAATLNKIVK